MDGEPMQEAEPGVVPPVEQNIRALMGRRAQELATAAVTERIAAGVTGFLGSIWSVVVHAAVFGCWLIANLGLVGGVKPWDPTFVVLGMIASVEAIFLTTFVLINQNRLAQMQEDRGELALQIGLLAERETSKLVEVVAKIAHRLDVSVPEPEEVEHLSSRTRPEAVLEAINRQKPEPL